MAKASNKTYFAVLDIGSSKIVCLNIEIDCLGAAKVIGVGHQLAKGIGNDGVIADVKALEESIISAVSMAEKAAGYDIENILVNFSGNKLRSKYQEIEIDISGGEVTDKDVERINELAFDNYTNHDVEVVQVVPINYAIDGINGISNPRYMCGKKLVAQLNLVALAQSALHNLLNCLARCHLNVSGILPSSYASALAVLSYEEMQNGVTVFDIGEGNTNLAIFHEGKMIYTASFPFAGKLLTRDIQQIFSLSRSDAERVKALYGSVFFDGTSNSRDTIDLFDMIRADESSSSQYIQKHKLSEIIYERSQEIFSYLHKFLQNDRDAKYAYQKAYGNIVLTGGGANLLGIAELVKDIFGVRTRIAKPKEIAGMPDEHKDAQFSTIYGLVKHGVQQQKNLAGEFKDFSNKRLFLGKLKKFCYYPQVSDFLRKYF